MNEHTNDEAERELPVAVEPGGDPVIVAGIVDSSAGGPECTLFPLTVDGFDRMTTWITALEGSFVGIDEMV